MVFQSVCKYAATTPKISKRWPQSDVLAMLICTTLSSAIHHQPMNSTSDFFQSSPCELVFAVPHRAKVVSVGGGDTGSGGSSVVSVLDP